MEKSAVDLRVPVRTKGTPTQNQQKQQYLPLPLFTAGKRVHVRYTAIRHLLIAVFLIFNIYIYILKKEIVYIQATATQEVLMKRRQTYKAKQFNTDTMYPDTAVGRCARCEGVAIRDKNKNTFTCYRCGNHFERQT